VVAGWKPGLVRLTADRTRTGLFVLVAMVLTAAICDDAVAKTGKRRLHAHHPVESRRMESPGVEGLGGEPAKNEQARLGPMRYYGGPKSPMWRGPAEN
jgi:hypothetical protein